MPKDLNSLMRIDKTSNFFKENCFWGYVPSGRKPKSNKQRKSNKQKKNTKND